MVSTWRLWKSQETKENGAKRGYTGIDKAKITNSFIILKKKNEIKKKKMMLFETID